MEKYRQLYKELRTAILNGTYQPGDMIPSHKEIMARWNVSLATVSHATRLLVEDGLIYRRRRAGSFVKDFETSSIPPRGRIYIIGDRKMWVPLENANWFVGEELNKGVINNCPFEIKIIKWSEIKNSLKDGIKHKGYFFRGGINEEISQLFKDVPMVWWNSSSNHQIVAEHNNVGFESISSSCEAVSWLLRYGHRKIGCIFAHSTRYAGYRMALNTYSIPLKAENVLQVPGKIKPDEIGDIVYKFLKNNKMITALFIDTDLKALWAIDALQRKGINIPEDVSIMGFDNIPEISEHQGLTTLDVPRYEMGKAAIEMLEKLIRNNNKPVPAVLFKGNVIERSTCLKLENKPR